MVQLEKIREKIIALSESDAKSLLMLIAANIDMVYSGNGSFTSDNCVNEIKKIYQSIPEPKRP